MKLEWKTRCDSAQSGPVLNPPKCNSVPWWFWLSLAAVLLVPKR